MQCKIALFCLPNLTIHSNLDPYIDFQGRNIINNKGSHNHNKQLKSEYNFTISCMIFHKIKQTNYNCHQICRHERRFQIRNSFRISIHCLLNDRHIRKSHQFWWHFQRYLECSLYNINQHIVVIKTKQGLRALNLEYLASRLVPTWKASPSISRLKLRYCHVLLLTIMFISTETPKIITF